MESMKNILNLNRKRWKVSVFLSIFCVMCFLHFQSLVQYSTESLDSPLSYMSLPDIHQMRRHLVEEVCKTIYPDGIKNLTGHLEKLYLHNILVDDSRKIMYCMLPKVACTNWIRTLAMTSKNISLPALERIYYHPELSMGKDITDNTVWPADKIKDLITNFPLAQLHTPRFNRAVGIAHLDSFPPEGIIYRMRHYYKFMFSRHPFVRLLSAYRDKLEKGYDRSYRNVFGREIVRKYRKNPSQMALDRGDDVTFQEFVEFVVESEKARRFHNPHWQTYFRLCHPCAMRYDFYGKFETLPEDADIVLPHLTNEVKQYAVPSKSHGPITNTSVQVVRNYYKEIKTDLISNLRRMYDLDFLMFGYDQSNL